MRLDVGERVKAGEDVWEEADEGDAEKLGGGEW